MFLFQKVPNKIHASSCLLRVITIPSRRLHMKYQIVRKPEPGDPPDIASYDAYIEEAGNHRDLSSIEVLLRHCHKNGGYSTSKTFRFIKNTTRDFHAVLRELYVVIASMKEYGCRKNALDALIARLCQLNRVEECIFITNKMIHFKFGADLQTFYPILHNLSRHHLRLGSVDAWDLIRTMKHSGIWPDEKAYCYLLKPVCCAGEVDIAARVLQAMEDDVEIGERTYGLLVLGACQCGNVEGALALLRRLEPKVLRKERYGYVIGEMIQQGLYDQAMEFVMGCYAGKKGMEVDEFMFQSLAIGLIDVKRSAKAAVVMREMMKRNLPLCEKLQDFCTQMRW